MIISLRQPKNYCYYGTQAKIHMRNVIFIICQLLFSKQETFLQYMNCHCIFTKLSTKQSDSKVTRAILIRTMVSSFNSSIAEAEKMRN